MSISTMKKLTVITPMDCADAIVKRLIKLRCIDVRSTNDEDYSYLLQKKKYDSRIAETAGLIASIESVLPVLTRYSTRSGGLGDTRARIARDEFVRCGDYKTALDTVFGTQSIIGELQEIDSECERLQNLILSIEPWKNLGYSFGIVGTDKTDAILGAIPINVSISSVENDISELYASFDVISSDKHFHYISILVLRSQNDEILRILSQYGFVKAQLSAINMTPLNAEAEYKRQIAELCAKKERLMSQIKQEAERLTMVEALFDIESTNLTALKAMQKTADSDSCTFVTGWLPAEAYDKVLAALDKFDCAYEAEDPACGEEPPVCLKNNGFAKNFEWVIGMYSYPKYGSFDPTFIMGIFYFLIFGMMFADVGYGLILLLAGFIAPRLLGMREGMKRTFNMFGYCGISCVIQGVIFGGWFGDLPYAIMQNFMGIENAKEAVPFFNGLWFNPLDEPMTFLIVSLAAGGVHILAAMIIKFVLLCREGKPLDAIFDIGSWWIIFAGIALIFVVGTTTGLITAGVGALIIILTHGRHEKNIFLRLGKGLLGLYDITSYASDLLSYSRILALGLAAGVIAQVVNLIGTMMGPSLAGFIVFVLACIIGHLLNLAINILGSFVHTSRLQYLEFFNKFYVDGGEQFLPVEPSDKYTVEIENNETQE